MAAIPRSLKPAEGVVLDDFDLSPSTPVEDEGKVEEPSPPSTPEAVRMSTVTREVFSKFPDTADGVQACEFLTVVEILIRNMGRIRSVCFADEALLREIIDRSALMHHNLRPIYEYGERTSVFTKKFSLRKELVQVIRGLPLSESLSAVGIELGNGGFGRVTLHAYEDISFVRKRVPRTTREGTAISKTVIMTESKYLSRLNHPNIVTGFGHLHRKDFTDIFMEYVPGPTLSKMLRRKLLSPFLLSQCVQDIRSGLEYLHSKKLVFGDLKSDNIIYDVDKRRFRLVDLGSIRGWGEPTGPQTLSVAPPEAQERGYVMDPSYDYWSFGALLYKLETGGRTLSGAHTDSEVFAFLSVVHTDEGRALIRKKYEGLSARIGAQLDLLLALDPKERAMPHVDGR